MLQLKDTRIIHSLLASVALGVLIPEEGMALVAVKENGETVIKPSAGGVEGPFMGLSYERFAPPATVPAVKSYVIPAGLTVVLPRTPITGQLGVKVNGVQKTVVTTVPASAAQVRIVGDTLTFFAGEAGKTVEATFLYTPTIDEARTIVGDGPFAGLSSAEVGRIGRITFGQVATSCFDASVDWSAALYTKLAANGRFTVAADAEEGLKNVTVMNTPNGNNPFLVIELNVA